ncbi:MAG: phosphodiester glycosidase family protein [Syntrophaceae bacterium]|nr:phosphodiester glycosidase family protein [Syntrophaceae bacterium]
MRKVSIFLSISSLFLWALFISSEGISEDGPWKKVDDGLFLAQFAPPGDTPVKDSKITLIKINPTYYSLKLLCASELGKTKLTTREWCNRYSLISAINAGMYQKDGLTNVGYMKNFSHMNNPRLNSTYKAVLAFNRLDDEVPEIQIIDLMCQDFEKLKSKYQTFIQNIRMISCRQENVWAKQNKKWSLAVLGMDKGGHVLFIFSEAPYSGYDFNNILLSLPISIFNAMYLEGGREASLYFSAKGMVLEKAGIYESDFNGNTIRPGAQPIPNVIGIMKKKP